MDEMTKPRFKKRETGFCIFTPIVTEKANRLEGYSPNILIILI